MTGHIATNHPPAPTGNTLMKKPWLIPALLGAAFPVWADEAAPVLSATPVVRQVPVVRSVCPAGAANANAPSSGQPCVNQTFTENQTVAWDVVYELGGKPYSVQMPYDPGATVRLQLAPAASTPVMTPAPVPTNAGSFAQTELGGLAAPPGGPVPTEEQITYDTAPSYAPLYAQAGWPYSDTYVGGYYGVPYVTPYAWPFGFGLGLGLGWYAGYRGGYYGGYHPRPQPHYRGGYRGSPAAQGAYGGRPAYNAAPGARAYGGPARGSNGYGGGGGRGGGSGYSAGGGGGGGRYR